MYLSLDIVRILLWLRIFYISLYLVYVMYIFTPSQIFHKRTNIRSQYVTVRYKIESTSNKPFTKLKYTACRVNVASRAYQSRSDSYLGTSSSSRTKVKKTSDTCRSASLVTFQK